MNKNRNRNGITLIALIITIVVLIILAGIAINLTLGDNGIFKKATTAKEDYGIVAAREKIELKIAELQAEKEGKATLEELVEYLKDDPDINYTVSLTEITASLSSDITIGDTEEIYIVYNKYQFKVNKKLKTEYVSKVDITEDAIPGITASQIAADPTNFGKTVDYTPINGCTVGWQIFYADENNIYLIADDYVENQYAPSTLLKNGTYKIYTNVGYAINLRNQLNTVSNWTTFNNEKGNTDTITGGPTLQEFCASWN